MVKDHILFILTFTRFNVLFEDEQNKQFFVGKHTCIIRYLLPVYKITSNNNINCLSSYRKYIFVPYLHFRVFHVYY